MPKDASARRNNNRFLMISWFGKSGRDIIEGIGCEFNNLFLLCIEGGDLSSQLSFCELLVDFLPRTRCLFVSKSSKLVFCEIFAS